MKRYLVTGAMGFIGSHLCRRLLGEGHQVDGFDNLSSGCIENVKDLLNYHNFVMLVRDITKPEDFLDRDYDGIFNLACIASQHHYQASPLKTILANTTGMMNVLDFAKRKGAAVLQASTSEIYGEGLEHPQKENYWGYVNPMGLRSCYCEGKRIAETICFEYAHKFDMDIKVVRLFNTFGPNMLNQDGRVIQTFIKQALNNEPITVYGTGSQTRSILFIDDLIDGFLKVMNVKGPYGPVNIGHPEELTVLQIAELIKQLIPESTSGIIFNDLPKDDPTRRCPDITKAKKELGWEPQVNVIEGLRHTVQWFKNQKH